MLIHIASIRYDNKHRKKQSDGTYIAYNTDDEHCTLIGTGNTVKIAKEDFFNSIEEVKRIM